MRMSPKTRQSWDEQSDIACVRGTEYPVAFQHGADQWLGIGDNKETSR